MRWVLEVIVYQVKRGNEMGLMVRIEILGLAGKNVIPSHSEEEARDLDTREEFSVRNEIPRRAAPRNDNRRRWNISER
jgi:hypothetical protein